MMLLQKAPAPAVRARAAPVKRAVPRVVCQAGQNEEVPLVKRAVALPLAGMVAAALMAGAVLPEDALAASSSRSGGRVGGSSGFASRKSVAPSRSVQTQAAPSVSSTTVVVAPAPVYSPFGFSPFGGFGFGFGMPVFAPVSFFSFSSLFSLMFIMLLFSVVFGVIRGIMSSRNNSSSSNKKDDSWGDL